METSEDRVPTNCRRKLCGDYNGSSSLVNPESQEETYPVPDQADVLAEQTF